MFLSFIEYKITILAENSSPRIARIYAYKRLKSATILIYVKIRVIRGDKNCQNLYVNSSLAVQLWKDPRKERSSTEEEICRLPDLKASELRK